jgi:hypothetical protein
MALTGPTLTMLLSGNFNREHILRQFFSCEYAFKIFWDHLEIRVAHHRGTWYLVKVEKEVFTDYFEINDQWIVWDKANPILQGFIQAQKELFDTGERTMREAIAIALTNVLTVWGDVLQRIKGVEVIQPGRNASIDDETGDFWLAPQIDQWKP